MNPERWQRIEEPSKVVSRMSGAPARLACQLAGDLDNIVLMRR